MKRILSLLLCAVMLFSSALVFAGLSPAYAESLPQPSTADVEGACVYNFENKQFVLKDNADKRLFPTSSVKLMTGILAVEALADRLDETITVTSAMLAGVAGNRIGLSAGEVVTVRDMLWSMLVNGANDCAYVLACTVSGTVQDFVARMNARARELGALNTNYTNPSGMHDAAMYTTAADTATIAIHAYSLNLFMEAASSVKYVMPATNKSKQRTLYNRNCLLSVYYETSYYYPGAKGMNAGSTSEGGHCVVTTATNGELTYLTVVLGGRQTEEGISSYKVTAQLLDWAFQAFKYDEVLSPNQIICEIPVELSTATDYVSLVAKDTLNVFLPSDVDVKTEITLSWVTLSEELQAPVKKDQVVGTVTAVYNDTVLGTSDLIAAADVSRSELLFTFYKIEQFTKSPFFIATVIAAVFFTALYIFGTAFLRGRNRKKNRRF